MAHRSILLNHGVIDMFYVSPEKNLSSKSWVAAQKIDDPKPRIFMIWSLSWRLSTPAEELVEEDGMIRVKTRTGSEYSLSMENYADPFLDGEIGHYSYLLDEDVFKVLSKKEFLDACRA